MSRDPLVRHAGRLRNVESLLQSVPIMVPYAGNPQGALTAREGTFCWDTTGHHAYMNVSNLEGTDWARLGHEWERIEADSVTLTVGATTSVLADLQTARDGNFYHIDEQAGAPGISFIVDFVDVVTLEFVEINASYVGTDSHAVAVQLYNWTDSTWDTFDAIQNAYADTTTANGYIIGNHSFEVFESDNYIGTGANEGDVRVRFYHTPSGNAAHDLYIDEVVLYY